MQFPLTLRFKIVALAPQLTVTDATGAEICYVRQKLFKLKEAIEVFTDSTRSEKLCEIRADRIIDFSAKYTFYDRNNQPFGAIKRQGLKSIWRSRYEIHDHETPEMLIQEENAWTKVMDGFFGELPLIGMFSGYLFHPTYLVSRIADNAPQVRIAKQPAFFEGRFILEALASIEEGDQLRIVLATVLMVLLERSRG